MFQAARHFESWFVGYTTHLDSTPSAVVASHILATAQTFLSIISKASMKFIKPARDSLRSRLPVRPALLARRIQRQLTRWQWPEVQCLNVPWPLFPSPYCCTDLLVAMPVSSLEQNRTQYNRQTAPHIDSKPSGQEALQTPSSILQDIASPRYTMSRGWRYRTTHPARNHLVRCAKANHHESLFFSPIRGVPEFRQVDSQMPNMQVILPRGGTSGCREEEPWPAKTGQ